MFKNKSTTMYQVLNVSVTLKSMTNHSIGGLRGGNLIKIKAFSLKKTKQGRPAPLSVFQQS